MSLISQRITMALEVTIRMNSPVHHQKKRKEMIASKVEPEKERLYLNQIQEKKKRYESPYRFGNNPASKSPQPLKDVKKVEQRPKMLFYSQIKHLLNGFGRMIVYEYIGNKKSETPMLSQRELSKRIQEQDFEGIDGHCFGVQRMLEGEFSGG